MFLKRALYVLIALQTAMAAYAVDEIRNARLEGADVSVGKKLAVQDDKFPAFYTAGWYNSFASMTNKGTIEFGIDEAKRAFYSSDFSVEVTFDVIATDKYNNTQTFSNKKLKVIYHTAGSYTDKAKLVLEGFVKLDVEITNIDAKNLPGGSSIATPNELYLETEMATDRHYLFYAHTPPASASANINYNVISPCTTNTELEIYWDYVPGVEEYELEWTWVNDYTGSAQAYDFRFDATRVVTKNTFYRIPLIYEGGNILFRLRHIGRGGTNFEQRVEGPWITVAESGPVSAYPSNLKFNVGSYYGDQFNWSSTLTFDENGRKGSGVSFMDGMLMGRQSLARLNTDNKVIVQSVIYDNQGRPAISVLPVPVNSQCLLYQEDINKNSGGTLYGTADFDDDAETACENATDPLNVNAGASNYYSSSNPNKEGAQGYLPVAAGLPFVQVEYTNDMTGRIKSQSMPGEAHKLGEGKETKFFYSNPGDAELYQLFGSEAGNVKHYDKNIVSDANGQLSASYLDMEGRVVATALLGPKPLNVDGIEDCNSSVSLTDNMIRYNIADNDNYTLTSIKNIFIEQANAVQTFTYEFMPEDFSDICAPLCFDCIYELEFRITDNCNVNIITPVSVVVGNLSQTQSILNNCDEPILKYELSPGTPLSVTFPNVGNYTITKILRVSNKNLNKYVAAYIAHNTCFESYEDILDNQIEAIDFSSCNMDCESCSTSVAAYIAAYPSSHGGGTVSSEESERLYNECKAICLDQLDPCMAARQQMLQDFSPGGQYAAYDALTYTSSDNTSIFNASNVFGISYSNCSLLYEDANGNPNPKVDVMRSNQLVSLPVCSLTVKEFIQHFQPSWAKAFMNYHPEKCYLDFCEQNKASDQYDYGMLSTTSYDDAIQKGYFKPISGLTLPSAMCATGTVQQSLDPFFTGTGFGAVTTDNTALLYNSGGSSITNYYSLMLLYMNTQYPAYGANIDLFDVAQANVNKVTPTSGSSYEFGCVGCDKDKLWMMYRTLYLQQKLRLVSQARMDYVMKHGCFNGCMQGSGLNPFEPVTTTAPPTATSLNFIEAPAFACPPSPSLYPFYEFYTITGYPVAKAPYAKLSGSGYNGNLHDDYFQTQTPNTYGQTPACSIGNTSYFSGKAAHFPQLPFTPNGLLAFYDNLISNNSNSGPGNMPGSVTIPPAAGTGNNHCQATCESYVEEWINKLKDCNPVFDKDDDDYDLSTNVTIRDAIMDELVNVCVSGCNPQNPFGASTSDPDLLIPPTYTSFQQVIDHYATVYPAIIPNPNSAACSALNLDFPAPYKHDYSGSGDAQNKLDTCGCNKIFKNALEYSAHYTAGTLPAGVTTPAEYFSYTYNVPLYNYFDILCKCNAAKENVWTPEYSWNSDESEALLENGIPVPEVLSCTRCLNCAIVSEALTYFNSSHPDYIGTPQYNDLLENSLNGSLNMNLTAADYLDFYNTCTGQGGGSGGASCNSVSVKSQLTAFVNAYIALAKAQPVTGPVSVVVTNISHPAFFGSCLFGCNDEADLPTSLTIGITYVPASGPTPARLLVNTPTFSYWGGDGDCTEMNCSPHFDVITYLASPAVTSYVITDVLITSAVSGFNAALVGHYTDGSGYHSFSGIPFNYPCLNPGYVDPPEASSAMLCNQPFSPSLPIYEDCMSSMLNQAENNAQLIYQSYVDKFTALFIDKYKKKCLKAVEKYDRNYDLNEYHYTLYYYDQAGNLVRTVAPKGVQKLSTTDVALLQTASPPVIYPHHTYVTNYKYQSYGAPLRSNTPDEQYWDGTTSSFKQAVTDYVYDNIGRIQLSYNGQQKIDGKYSYTLYDEIGRIKEVGVLGNMGSVTVADLKTEIAANTFESYLSTHTPAFTRTEVIQTYYDMPLNSTISGQFGSGGQQNLRNRVATVSYETAHDNNSSTYTYATHYTYDEHGNVGRIIQDVPALAPLSKQYYTMDYDYDLISGNVNQVTYQAGSADQFMHRYEYDADNRLHNVYTSRDKVSWDKDAKYFYYEHGPLARTELGDEKVQGTDYAYTIHGWIKAVNSDILSEHTDMGKDGAQGNRYLSTQQSLHRFVGKDAAAYSLNYYQQGSLKDYTSIKSFNSTDNQNMLASTANILSSGSSFNMQSDAPDLYNGNISSMITSIYDMDLNSNNTHAENTPFPQITGYRYDQLHRIKQMKAFRGISLSTNEWNTATSGNYDGSYFTQFTYDKNGNITSQQRDGAAFMTGLGLPMDNMTYITQNTSTDIPTNRLIGVNDAATGAYVNDIKGTSTAVDGTPSSYDYEYDALGSLVKDKKEYINAIEWTVDRKVKKVTRDISAMVAAGKNLPDLEFEYDANRQRIVKIVKKHDNSTGALLDQDNWEYTYYVRDASGNITATYGKKYVPVPGHANTYTEELSLQEHDLYGSARLGTLPSNTNISSREFTATLSGGLFTGITYAAPDTPPAPCTLDIISPTGETLAVACPIVYERLLGNKRYELTNHLGNVLTVLSDRKLQNAGTTEDLANDYEQPFYGQSTTHLISGAHTCLTSLFNPFTPGLVTQVHPGDGVTATMKAYYDTAPTYDSPGLLALAFVDAAGNFLYASGGAIQWYRDDAGTIAITDNLSITQTVPLALYMDAAGTTPYTGAVYAQSFGWHPGDSQCWFDDHGLSVNYLVPLVDNYRSEILETHDYYAFGMDMPGRCVTPIDAYSYGMNGQMRERETFEGAYSADYWGYDSRLGRRWEKDPISYEWQSPYATFNNNPIYFADPLGLEGEPKTNKEKQAQLDVRNQVVNLDDDPPAKGTSSTNRSYTISGNFGQSKYSDAMPLPVLRGPSPSQKQAARIAGFLNALQSNQTLGIGRKHPAEIYTDPELQSLFLQGQIAGDISSIIGAEQEIAAGTTAIAVGSGMAVAGAAASATGFGAIVAIIGEGIAIAGEATVVHGQAVAVVASANLARSSIMLAATTYHNGNPSAAQSDGGGSGDGAQQNGEYEPADYHGADGNSVKSAGPENGQQALNESIIVKQKQNGSTRIAVQGEDQFIVLMEHAKGKFHGHVRSWGQLNTEMRNALIKAGKTNVKGKLK